MREFLLERRFSIFSELGVAFAVVLILTVMVLPLPAWLLDILLALSISISLLVLLTTVYIRKPLEFSAFPSVLLVVTLFRLSLNVATTRRILLYGNMGTAAAGHIIEAFGQFVVGGSYVVGFVIFLILVIINFIVITKGAQRIAEVAARFTLDAMPGKQMAIDADLNAGIIDEEEARRRRQEIQREADFYGAMDGASKFVRGDAIAGLIITFINIVGGLIIGVMQYKMSLSKAAKTYTILTIGDGLVSQIPALIVSTAAGILVSRAASESHLGSDIVKQLTSYPRALFLASGVLFFGGFVPGFPFLPFFLLSALFGILGYLGIKREKVIEKEEPKEETPEVEIERIKTTLQIDPIELELGYNLIPLVEKGDLLNRIRAMRRQIAQDLGFIVPPIRVRDNLSLPPNSYRILIYGTEVASGELMVDRYLAISPKETEKEEIEGIPAREPAFGIPALWVDEENREKAMLAGYTVVDATTVIITHLSEVIKKHAHELLGRDELNDLLDALARNYPRLVEDLVPNVISHGLLQKVLQNLLKEGVSIRNLKKILETLADFAPKIEDPELLTEYVRQALGRQIVKQYLTPDGYLPVILIDSELEKQLLENVQRTERGSFLVLSQEKLNELASKVSASLDEALKEGVQPVILTSFELRAPFRKFIERVLPRVPVLSHVEVPSDVKVKVLGVIK